MEWLGGTQAEDENEFPGVSPALAHLGDNMDIQPRQRARRMFAIAVLTRAFPEMQNTSNTLAELAIRALKTPEGTPEPESGAESVYARLAGIAPVHTDGGTQLIPGTQAWWTAMVTPFETVAAVSGAAEAGATGAAPRGMQFKPCAGRWVRVPGIDGPVDAVRTNTTPKGSR